MFILHLSTYPALSFSHSAYTGERTMGILFTVSVQMGQGMSIWSHYSERFKKKVLISKFQFLNSKRNRVHIPSS